MAKTEANLSVKLSNKQSWRKWFEAVRKEARRLNLGNHLQNVLVGNAAGSPPENNAVNRELHQRWRDLRSATESSCTGAAGALLENADHDALGAMDAGQLILQLGQRQIQ